MLREQDPEQAIAALRAFQPDCPLGVQASSPGPAHSHALDPAGWRWSKLLCRRYLRRTARITLPWFLMDIVDYGYNIYIQRCCSPSA